MTVIQYWDAEEPPQQIVELLATFPRHNPGSRQLLFSESSAEALIAEHFTDREVRAFRACAVPASQADYLRYCAGYALGGICLDADIQCGGDLGPVFAGPHRGILFGQQERLPDWIEHIFAWPYRVGPYRLVANGAFAFEQARNPLLGLAIEVATANIENRVADGLTGVWLTTGPGVLTSIYLLQRLGSIDAFMRFAEGTVLDSTAALFCEVVGDWSRVDDALDGVEMAPVEKIDKRVLRHVGVPRSEMDGAHWSTPEGSIFR
ncbi:MAG: hypothetical protein ABW196_09570 [Solirubrobacterales bacterium]